MPEINYKELTKAQRWAVADLLAADRLPAINANLDDVVPSDTLYAKYGKRAIDIILSGGALVATLPLNAIIGVITLVDVGRPLFFKQQRIGKDERPFVIVKSRNMRNTRDERGELLPPAQRVTKFGRFVRRTSLDELLNFWSVFKGDMSIIGPRPLLPEHTHRFNKRHRMRLAVRPGLECPPREMDGHFRSWQEQFDNDIWYVENLSFKTDCMMFANLVRLVFDRNSTAARAVGSARGIFTGYDLDGNAITLDQVPQEYLEAAVRMVPKDQKVD